eukprot:2219275-Rhodomonas_salina.1
MVKMFRPTPLSRLRDFSPGPDSYTAYAPGRWTGTLVAGDLPVISDDWPGVTPQSLSPSARARTPRA